MFCNIFDKNIIVFGRFVNYSDINQINVKTKIQKNKLDDTYYISDKNKAKGYYEFNHLLKSWNFNLPLKHSCPYFCFEVYVFMQNINEYECISKISSPKFIVYPSRKKTIKISETIQFDNNSDEINKRKFESIFKRLNDDSIICKKPCNNAKRVEQNFLMKVDKESIIKVNMKIIDEIVTESNREEISLFGTPQDTLRDLFIKGITFIDSYGNIKTVTSNAIM